MLPELRTDLSGPIFMENGATSTYFMPNLAKHTYFYAKQILALQKNNAQTLYGPASTSGTITSGPLAQAQTQAPPGIHMESFKGIIGKLQPIFRSGPVFPLGPIFHLE